VALGQGHEHANRPRLESRASNVSGPRNVIGEGAAVHGLRIESLTVERAFVKVNGGFGAGREAKAFEAIGGIDQPADCLSDARL